jgi:TonB dependent receptor/CarboxypepD_reg-like domain/TonB-dependent Receptor Plug Domain
MNNNALFVLTLLFFPSYIFAQKKITVSGYVKEKGSQEQLFGVSVFVKGKTIGTNTNTYGFYSLTLPAAEKVTLTYSYVGYTAIDTSVVLDRDMSINVFLPTQNDLQEIVVSAKKQSDKVSEEVQMSKIEIPIQQIKKIPAFLGEKDVLRVLQLMPGVQKGSEGQTGIYVRGGGPDQNLIILDDANVYNANHLFGFFSVFNGDALKSVELTKGGFPARFGGRLSSVIDLNMKEGNKEKFTGEGGIGLIASRLTLEGPIKRNKSSFLISARRTYLDVLAKPFIALAQSGQDEKVNAGYFFYDLNAKFNIELSQKDKLYASGYFGKDLFKVNAKSTDNTENNGLNWGNATTTLRWNHLFNSRLFSNLSFIFTDYNFKIYAKQKYTSNNTTNVFNLNYVSSIRDYGFKYDFDFFPNPKHSIKMGVQGIYHIFKPSAIVFQEGTVNNLETNFSRNQKTTNVIEAGIYAEDTWSPTDRLKINGGLRLSNYQSLGATYYRPEPRLAMAYKLGKDMSIKGSYSKMNQYIHLLTNSGLGLPTDLWVPTTSKVAPQSSEQVALGLAKDFPKQGLSLTLEGYYKRMGNILSYKEGSSFLFFDDPTESTTAPNWQDQVTAGNGKSYGLELFLQKNMVSFRVGLAIPYHGPNGSFQNSTLVKNFTPSLTEEMIYQ